MTLGASPTITQILAELGQNLPYTFPTAETRWLADVGAASAITFPTNFANKTSVKIVDSGFVESSSNTVNFSANFGIAFPGRVLVFCYGVQKNSDTPFNASSCTIGGAAAVGSESGEFSGGGNSVGAGMWSAANASGSAGTVSLTGTSSGLANDFDWALLSIASVSGTPQNQAADIGGGAPSGSISNTINIPANGVLISAVRAGTNVSFTGVTKRLQQGNLAVGFNNRLGVQSNRNVEASWSPNSLAGMRSNSYAQ